MTLPSTLKFGRPIMWFVIVLLISPKNDARTKQIPIVVLTTDDPRKWRRAANLYKTKPVEYELFIKAIQELGRVLPVVKVPDWRGSSARPGIPCETEGCIAGPGTALYSI